jgi:hypothetical protein
MTDTWKRNGEDEVERKDGPLHDPDRRVFDATYSDGSWDTLTVMGESMVLVGLKIGPFDLVHLDKTKQHLQGGMYTMVRGEDQMTYVMTIGGGD